MEFIVVCLAFIGLVTVVLLALAHFLPSLDQVVERSRIEQEMAEASWRIHQQATDAFGRLLQAARAAKDEEQPS